MVPQPSPLDLLLKGGHVVDPANDLDGAADVGVYDGRIARVEADIPAVDATHVVDVSGLYVTPGLLDIHVHTYDLRWAAIDRHGARQPGKLLLSGSLRADAHFLKEGVTTCVDTGTAGADEFEHFRRACIETSSVRQFAYVNIACSHTGNTCRVNEHAITGATKTDDDGVAETTDRSQRHPVDISGGRSITGVEVAVGSKPDQTDLLDASGPVN